MSSQFHSSQQHFGHQGPRSPLFGTKMHPLTKTSSCFQMVESLDRTGTSEGGTNLRSARGLAVLHVAYWYKTVNVKGQ
eukprot:1567092-Rhodomonas_salina.2